MIVTYEKNVYKIEEAIKEEGRNWPVKLKEHFTFPSYAIIDAEYSCFLYNKGSYTKPTFIVDGNKLIAKYYIDTWLLLESDNPSQYIEKYESMVNSIIGTEGINVLFQTHKEIDELGSKIRGRLWFILERRDYIWHTCSLCPSPPV